MRSSHACLLLLVLAVFFLGGPLHSSAQHPSEPKPSRYVNFIDINKGVLLTLFYQGPTHQSLGFSVVNAFQLHPALSLGLGTGVDLYDGSSPVLFPLFADMRIRLLPTAEIWTPIFSLGTGYSFSLYRGSERGGFYCHPAFGAQFHASQHLDLTLGVGYRYQGGQVELYGNFYPYPMRMLVMRIGVGIR